MKKTISGIRGVVGDDFTIKDVIKFCNNFANLTDGNCVTGMDTRPSSDMITRIVHAGLMEKGVNVYSLGMVPTPVVFREAKKIGAGVMITSSHNPPKWNGLKFILNGRGINESELPHIIDTQNQKHDNDDTQYHKIKLGTENTHFSSYVKEAAEIIGDVKGEPQIIVDAGGGAAINVAPQVYKKIGCKVKIINRELYSRGPDPTVDNLSNLIESSSKAKIGFAFDLDGDRLVIVLNGKKQTPDTTLGLGIMGALERGCKNFVLSTDTSLGVEKLISLYGGTSTRTKVGEANVVDEMIKKRAQAGGEGSSGGFILSEFNYCRDGILAGGMIIAGMADNIHNNNTSSQLYQVLDTLDKYHIIRTKIHAISAQHTNMIERALKWLETESTEVQKFDGIKGIIDENSWILVRRSNTEDVIRISAESNDAAKCNALVNKISNIIKQQ